jgi:hypothetical protein
LVIRLPTLSRIAEVGPKSPSSRSLHITVTERATASHA